MSNILLWGILICLSMVSWGLAAQQGPDVTPGRIQLSGASTGGEWPELVEQGGQPPPDETTIVLSFGLIVLGVLLWGGFRWYQHTPQVRGRQRQEVLVRMAALDERYGRGEITEQRYRQTRQRLKQRAIQLTYKND